MVSSIIIFFNVEKYIQEAIDSVFSQTYTNWELILVDDGSTDSSTKIALRYAEQHPGRVRYVEHDGHENRGMSASRNLGIQHARGEYITFLDADDVWLPQKIKRQVAILEKHPEAAVVFGPWESWSSWSKNPESPDVIQNLQIPTDRLVRPPNLLSVWLQKEIAIPGHCATLMRRKAAQAVGGFEDAFRDHYEDLVLLSKIHLRFPVFVDGECLSRYRQHPDSCCYGQGRVRFAWEIYLNWLESYLVRQKSNDREVWKALREELRPYRHPILHWLVGWARHPVKKMKRLLKSMAIRALPAQAYGWILIQWRTYRQTG